MQSPSPAFAPKSPDTPLRVLIIGRISTPHQNEENIEASYRYVEDHLRKLHPGPLQIKQLGERASGMLAERQTIRQAEDLMAAGQVDLVVAEDLSRIFRNPRHQFNFVQDAVDAGVRILCLADNLDTADENWELMLGAAGLRHGLVVSDTRRRVRRTATHSFHGGGMVMKVRFGYRKLTKEEADSGQLGPKGLRVAKDPACTPVIRQMRELVLSGKPYVSIADWLTSQAIAPGRYAKKNRWTAKLLIDFLRAPILHGERTFRSIIYQPVLRTGKHRRESNPKPERALCEQLAHFTVEEHAELLAIMDERAAAYRRRRGRDHPRYRVPRSKALWPAQHLVCSVCGGLMYAYDRGKLKCSNTFHRGDKQCWNHVQVDSDCVRRGVLQRLCELLQPLAADYQNFLDACWASLQGNSTSAGKELAETARELLGLKQQAQRLAKAIGEGGEMSVLVERLKEVQATVTATEARQSALRAQAADQLLPIDRAEFAHQPLPTLLDQCRTSHAFAEVLKRFITSAAVVPVQDLLHGQVRPRVRMTVELADEASAAARRDPATGSLTFDVFDWPQYIRLVEPLRQLKCERPDAKRAELAELLHINIDVLKRTTAYTKLMGRHGISEPYIELTAKPSRASRWRHRNDAT